MIQSYFEATVRMPDYTTVSETPPCGKQLSPMLSCSCGKLRRSPVSVSDRPMNKRGLLSVPPHLGTLQDETNGESQHRSIKDGHLKDFAEEAEMLRDCPFSSAQPHNDIVTSASIRNAMCSFQAGQFITPSLHLWRPSFRSSSFLLVKKPEVTSSSTVT
ncbi:uncharacterized protein LOC109522649 isoform X3 [Hippocampus comes]|uniref:uncharacterized protein LOC109522649 isoform X3 n=1 Tax=Hippocampus comes TaxID=109280 RepID=UPI00094E3511|nr:PREDICTED: uncharacterized protein LOC109522649 isoform X3 [Hippocampus comes]